MFGLAWCAAWRPAHDDWLNEWSSTPPVSSTMQALNAWPPPPLEAEGVFVLPLPAFGVAGFWPHPASRSAAAPATAAILVA